MKTIKKRKTYQMTRDKHLSEVEIDTLKRKLSERLKEDPDKYLLVLLAMETGARRSELIKLTASSLNFSLQTLYIEATKDSKDRELPLRAKTIGLLKKYVAKNGLDGLDLLFWSRNQKTDEKIPISISKILRTWWDIRPGTKKFHSLRHTFALELYKKRRDINLVKAALGHRNIQNTMIYVEYEYQTTELRRLILGPQKVS